jgi:hypothetical protein
MSDRRRFLLLSSAALACVAAPRVLLAESTNRRGIPVFSNAALGAAQQGLLTKAHFDPLVGSSFHAFLDDYQVMDITLFKVTDLAAKSAATTTTTSVTATKRLSSTIARPGRMTTGFTLAFYTGSTVIPQDSYVLDHGSLGSFTTLLVAGNQTAGMRTSCATFNYL